MCRFLRESVAFSTLNERHTMRFEEGRSGESLARVETSANVGVANQFGLCLCARHGDALRSTILIRASLADDAFDWVTIPDRSAQRLETDDDCALASAIAVCCFIEHLAARGLVSSARGKRATYLRPSALIMLILLRALK